MRYDLSPPCPTIRLPSSGGARVSGPCLVETFDVLGAQLKEIVKKKQNHKTVKVQGASIDGKAAGIIRKIVPDESYGFIVTDDKLDVFFHANSLKDVGMSDLSEGDEVLFAMEEGDKGLAGDLGEGGARLRKRHFFLSGAPCGPGLRVKPRHQWRGFFMPCVLKFGVGGQKGLEK